MKDYKGNEDFKNFLVLLGYDIDSLNEQELNKYYTIYTEKLESLLNIYNKISNMDDSLVVGKNDIDKFSELFLDNLFDLNFDDTNEDEMKEFSENLVKISQINAANQIDDTLIYVKTYDFIKKNKMDLEEMEINYRGNDDLQYVKEVWVHRKTGYTMTRGYPITDKTCEMLEYRIKKEVINKQLEIHIEPYAFQIASLNDTDRKKYYEYVLKSAINDEDYEKAAKYRDLINNI